MKDSGRRSALIRMPKRIASTKLTGLLSLGQLSVEALLLFLVFLTLLAIAYAAAGNVGSAAQRKISASLSQADFNDFSSKAAQACMLGNGNVRTTKLRGTAATIFAEGSSVLFSTGNFSATANTSCGTEILQAGPAKEFTIRNRQGMLEIS
ncbi:Uncharacterised protein [uncultured archaeon]|nr:Uncharacterised protein [uncultured archaeon]